MILRIKFLLLLLLTFSNGISQPLSGKKTIGATGNYTTIQAAITALTTNGVSGTVNFAIQPGTYDEGISLTTSITGLTGSREINFAPTSGTVIWKAAPIASISSSASIRLGANKKINFSNITFDLDTTGTSGNGVYIDGTADSVSFTGCTFINSDGVNGYGIRASLSNTLGKLTVTNCTFSGLGIGIYYDKTANAILSNSHFTISNNTFSNISSAALSFEAVGKIIVTGNTVSNFTGSGFSLGYGFIENVSNNILYSTSGGNGSAILIGNKFKNTGYFGKFYNNMISMTNRTGNVTGIFLDNYDSLKIMHNTISLSSNNGSTALKLNEFLGNNYTQIKNNIFQQDQGTALFFPANPNDRNITADFNNYVSNTFSFITVVSTAYSFANYKLNFSQDANSKNKTTTFVSSTDLHLSGSSLGDQDLKGSYDAEFATDMDGNSRTAISAYIGADEADGYPLPVEMSSFNYTADDGLISLTWSTKSETNNYGWEVERSSPHSNQQWKKIGFVAGKGTTTESQNYSFAVNSLEFKAQSHSFRLKQIDHDGKFSYSNILTIDLTPNNYSLSQNYPNPFNPSTAISYQLSAESKVSLVVFDLLGREVATLVNEEKAAGNYKVNFSAMNLPSGVYFYRLTTGSFTDVRKMTVMK